MIRSHLCFELCRIGLGGPAQESGSISPGGRYSARPARLSLLKNGPAGTILRKGIG